MTAVDPARTPPSWALIDAQAQRLRDRRPEDVFLDQVLTGALRVAQDAGNPIRGNQFAAASRELATHLLNALAPEAQVRACAWFVQAKDTPTVTRAQRALFIAHGGLAPDYVEKTLGFASGDFTTPLKQAIDELNKRTHVKPDTVLGEEGPVCWLAVKIFDAIEGLLEAADECRSEVVVELRDQIDQQVLERMIGETIGELDILSGHTLVDRSETTEIEVTEITADQVRFRIEGTVYVNLQWGSGSDFRDGDGASMSEEFPFSAGLITATADPSKFEAVIDLNVDTDGWYE